MGLFCQGPVEVVSAGQDMAFVGYMAVRGFLPFGSEACIGFKRRLYL